MRITHTWDKENYIAKCEIQDHDMRFVGEAKCHPDDQEFVSAITGGYIAEGRAYIKLYQHTKNFVVKPQIDILQYTLHSIKQSKYYNPNSLATVKIEQELARKKSEYEQLKFAIDNEKLNLKYYIADKDKLHKFFGKKKQLSN